jgi:hypothetical protein
MCPALAWLLAFNHLPGVDSITLAIRSPNDVPVLLATLQDLARTAHNPKAPLTAPKSTNGGYKFTRRTVLCPARMQLPSIFRFILTSKHWPSGGWSVQARLFN